MTWVKICGMTNVEDALTAVEAGADALGFVFYEKSPRNVSVHLAGDIIRRIPSTIEKVGVFVDGSSEVVREFVERAGLGAIQMHFDLSTGNARLPALEVADGVKRYIALSARNLLDGAVDFEGLWRCAVEDRVDAIFLDSGTSQTLGGTGQVFIWEKATPLGQGIRAAGLKLVVAGGLNQENVAGAMRTLGPWGVDVSSGVETRPGKKDPAKVRAFITAVRNADKGIQ